MGFGVETVSESWQGRRTWYGKTLKEIRIDNDEDTVKFITDCGKTYLMGHVDD